MKKALLFIGLAMCTTFAFAQTNNYAKPVKDQLHQPVQKLDVKQQAMQNADYKASIFTKAVGDTLAQWHFNSLAEMANITYGDDGRVTAGMMVGTDSLAEGGATHPSTCWQWIQPGMCDWQNAQFAATFPRLSDTSANGRWWMGEYLVYYLTADDGGFMLMSLFDFAMQAPDAGTDARTAQLPHSFFSLPAVARPSSDLVIDVAYRQVHVKFYDQSFIDYKVNGVWYQREVNINGIDANINYWSAISRRYAMPAALGTQDNIEIRFRYLGGLRSNAYGYMWGVDDVALISGGHNRWTADDQDFGTGAYGTVPQGMELPISWYADVYNAGYYDIANVNISATHIAENGATTNVLNIAGPTLAAGDPTAAYGFYINEQGLNDSTDGTVGWFGYAPAGHYGATTADANYQYRHFPTTTLGRNRATITATADSNLVLEWDTIAYRVVGYSTEDELAEGNTVEGYRWGHDNGIIAAGNSYQYGFTADGNYITEEGNWNQATYSVTSRYVTGMNIPTDANGDPWVLRGVELITSPELSISDVDGAKIRPVTYQDYYDGGTVSFGTLDNGVNQVVTTLNGSDVTNTMATGYGVATEDGYQAVSIFFPMQPELEPNTSYRVGYRLASAGRFCVGSTSTRYYNGSTNVSYDSSAVTRPWRHQFWPNAYDVTVDDPMGGGILWASYYHDYYPMIRAIVGPREQLPSASVNVLCEETDYTIEYLNESYCGATLTVPETSGPTFYIIPASQGDQTYMVLDTLYVDGQPVALPSYDDDGDDDFIAVDYSIVDTIHNPFGDDEYFVNLERYYWMYTFRNIQGTHSISAHAHLGEFIPTGVDPVASEAKMTLAPNPATSQVALSISGVSGMVNCNIIDMSGRTVYSNTINAESTNTIDLRNVPAGAYFVRITNDKFSKVEKLIVR